MDSFLTILSIMLIISVCTSVIVYFTQLPTNYFYFQPERQFLLDKYLKSIDRSVEDRIVYLNEKQVRKFMSEFYTYISLEVERRTDEFGRVVVHNNKRHSIKQILYLESIEKSTIDVIVKFLNSQLKDKIIKI